MINEWRVSGQIVRITERSAYDVGAAVVIRTYTQRLENDSSQICD